MTMTGARQIVSFTLSGAVSSPIAITVACKWPRQRTSESSIVFSTQTKARLPPRGGKSVCSGKVPGGHDQAQEPGCPAAYWAMVPISPTAFDKSVSIAAVF